MAVLYVAVGGSIGAVLRYFIYLGVQLSIQQPASMQSASMQSASMQSASMQSWAILRNLNSTELGRWLSSVVGLKALWASGLPMATVLANIIGCLLAGIALPFLQSNPEWKPMIGFGFLGSLTTLSTFSVELIQLLDSKHYMLAAIYWAISSVLCVGFCAGGIAIGNRLCTP